MAKPPRRDTVKFSIYLSRDLWNQLQLAVVHKKISGESHISQGAIIEEALSLLFRTVPQPAFAQQQAEAED